MKKNPTNLNHPKDIMMDYLLNMDKLPYGTAIIKNDKYATVVEANESFYAIIGYTKEEFKNIHQNRLLEILIDDVYSVIQKDIKEKKDFNTNLDLRIHTADKRMVWIHDMLHYDAMADLFFITLVDITNKMIPTERNLSYEAFQTRNEILGYLNLYNPSHISVTDAYTDEVIYINDSAAKLLGMQNESDWVGKKYTEIGFGNEANVHPSYREPVSEDEFTFREYYNKHHKIYVHCQSRIITIPSLNRKMRINFINDITAETKLKQQVNLQNTLHQCIDSLFTAGVTEVKARKAYKDVLNQLKTYYQADRAFFYKFKEGSQDIEEVIETSDENLNKIEFSLPITATRQQMLCMKEITEEIMVSIDEIINKFNPEYQLYLKEMYKRYQIHNVSSIAIKNVYDEIIAFMGVTNPHNTEDNKELMEVLTRFICMFIEFEHSEKKKKEAIEMHKKELQLELNSKDKLWNRCRKNYIDLTSPKDAIKDTLDELCRHYDADFALIVKVCEDGSCTTSYYGGQALPDLEKLDHHPHEIIKSWVKIFEKDTELASDIDFVDSNSNDVKRILDEKYGIFNFIVSPVRNEHGVIDGLLFVDNVKHLHRARLLVHAVAKATSDYLAKISIHQKNHIEPSTKLSNKVATEQLISKALENEQKGTLFIIDMDHFKQLNDTLGHLMGDKAIVDVAEILKQLFRSTDIIGRVGGDEFMVYSQGLTNFELIQKKAQNIQERCQLVYEKDHQKVAITVSIGVCTATDDHDSYESLYEKADKALYIAKKSGKNNYQIHK